MTRRGRRLLSAWVAVSFSTTGWSATPLVLPETGIAYRIEATLDPSTRRLLGMEVIRWTNSTGASVPALPLHLYLNGFSHSGTTWMREVAWRLRLDDLLDREADPWGYIEPLSIRVRGPEGDRDAAWHTIQPDDGNPLDRSLAEVTLPLPVPPGGEVVLTVQFEARLPVPIARTGGTDSFFLVAQWYPKIGVIEPAGVRGATATRSAAHQFHGLTEFYADFADYDVTFTVPDGWLLGATGSPAAEPVRDTAGLVSFHYRQRAVHDFALVTGRNLTDEFMRHEPQGGGPPVEIRFIVPAGTEHQIPRLRRAVEGSLDVLGSRLGPYPYETLTVVAMPYRAARTAGMEYPTFFTAFPGDPLWDNPLLRRWRLPEVVVTHEFGHQYFYGLLASNEQEEAFLDEGFDSYWETEIMRTLYGDDASWGYLFGRRVDGLETQALTLAAVADEVREPMRRLPSWILDEDIWGPQTYERSALTFATAARLFGENRVDHAFREYFRRFAFKHPGTADFLTAAEAGGPEFVAFCLEAFERERVPDFAVTEVTTARFEPPLGRLVTENGPIMITAGNRKEHSEAGLPAEAHEADGRVLVEITDPGWAHGAQVEIGSVTRRSVEPDHLDPRPGHRQEGFHESTVRLEGPGWDTLPVEVEIRFADGAVIHDRWDGKAAWRRYRFVRGAPVVEARVDPDRRIVLDVKPQNNALAASPEHGFATDWGLWLGAVGEWLAGAMSFWL